MLDIIRRLTKYMNLLSSINFTDLLGVSSGAAAAVSRVHLRSENTPWRRRFVQRIVVGKRGIQARAGPRPGQFTSSQSIAGILLAWISATVLHDLGISHEMVQGLALLS